MGYGVLVGWGVAGVSINSSVYDSNSPNSALATSREGQNYTTVPQAQHLLWAAAAYAVGGGGRIQTTWRVAERLGRPNCRVGFYCINAVFVCSM